jgi:hypothetical protein
MRRVGQPAVMGPLIAGMVLGPSVLGALWPDLQHAIFPNSAEQKSMLDAVSQLGILMLLLLTGMETDLKLVRRVGRVAVMVETFGVAVPFACGVALGEMFSDSILPRSDQRFITGRSRVFRSATKSGSASSAKSSMQRASYRIWSGFSWPPTTAQTASSPGVSRASSAARGDADHGPRSAKRHISANLRPSGTRT